MPTVDELLPFAGSVLKEFCCLNYTVCKELLDKEIKRKKPPSPTRDMFYNFLASFINAEKALTSMAFLSGRSLFSKLMKSSRSSIPTYKVVMMELQKFEDLTRQIPSSRSIRNIVVANAGRPTGEQLDETNDMACFVKALKLIVNARSTLMEVVESLFTNAAVHTLSAALFEEKCALLRGCQSELRAVLVFSRSADDSGSLSAHEAILVPDATIESVGDFAPLHAFVQFAALELRIIESMLDCDCALLRHDYFDALAANYRADDALRRMFTSVNPSRLIASTAPTSVPPLQPLHTFYLDWKQLLLQKTALLFHSVLDRCESPKSPNEAEQNSQQFAERPGSTSKSDATGDHRDLVSRIHSFQRTFSQRHSDCLLTFRIVLCLGSHAPDGVPQEHLNSLLMGYRFPVDSILLVAKKNETHSESRSRNESETRANTKPDSDGYKTDTEEAEAVIEAENSENMWPVTGINLFPVVFACPSESAANPAAAIKQQRIWPAVVMLLTELFPAESLASGSTMRSYGSEKDTLLPFANSLTQSITAQPVSATSAANRSSSISGSGAVPTAGSSQSVAPSMQSQALPTVDWSNLYAKVLFSKANDYAMYLHRVDTHYALLATVEPSQSGPSNAQLLNKNEQIEKFVIELATRMRTAQLFNDFRNSR